MRYWGDSPIELVDSIMNLEDMEYEKELPDDVEVPEELSHYEDDLFAYYMEALVESNGRSDAIGAAEDFLDHVKGVVEDNLFDLWDTVTDTATKSATVEHIINRLGDEFAHEEFYAAMGGDPEYNFLDDLLSKFLEEVNPNLAKEFTPKKEGIAKELIKVAQQTSDVHWEDIEFFIRDAFSEARESLKERIEELLEEEREDED